MSSISAPPLAAGSRNEMRLPWEPGRGVVSRTGTPASISRPSSASRPSTSKRDVMNAGFAARDRGGGARVLGRRGNELEQHAADASPTGSCSPSSGSASGPSHLGAEPVAEQRDGASRAPGTMIPT